MPRRLIVSTAVALGAAASGGAPARAAAAAVTQLELAAGPAIKLSVTAAGWQRVSQPTLLAAGLDPAVDPRQLRLFADGVEQGLSVTGNGDGAFDPDEAIEFYGVPRDTLWTGTRTYWLVAGGAGKPIPFVAYPAEAPPPANFPAAAILRQRTTYFAALKNGEASNFFGDQVTASGATEAVTVTHVDVSQPATLQLVLQGVTAGNHQIAVSLGGQAVGTCSLAGQVLATCTIPAVSPVEGVNDVQLVAGGDAPDVSLVDSVEIDYSHLPVADGDALMMTVPPIAQMAIAGFSSPDVRVMDVSDPDSPVELVTSVSAGGSGYTAYFNTPGETSPPTLFAFTGSAAHTPVATASRPSNWTAPQAGELVVLANARFMDALAPLVRQRRQQGWSVQLIDLQDVYDEFGGGDKTPYAVRSFLQAIHGSWTPPPRFVLLVGDASFDPRNFLGLGDFDFAPTKLIDTQQMETSSDDWFVDWNDDNVPDIAIGRISVRTAAEAATVVQKIVGYGADLSGGALFVADQDETGLPFEEDSLASAASLAGPLPTSNFFLDQPTSTEAALLPLLDTGPFLVNYMGHGSVSVWDGLLSGTDAAALTNGRLSIYVAMNCLNGFFHDLYTESLAETLTKAPAGGAVAVWASSTLTSFDQQGTLNREFVKRLTRTSLGEAAIAAKRAITDPDAQRTWMLFGDPTLFGTPTPLPAVDGGLPSDAGAPARDAGAGGHGAADAGRAATDARGPIADVGAPDAQPPSSTDGGRVPADGDGCGCRVGGSSSAGACWILAFGWALARVRRRQIRAAADCPRRCTDR